MVHGPNILFGGFSQLIMGYDDVVPPEKVAFIAYNIGVYESVQKFGNLITSERSQIASI